MYRHSFWRGGVVIGSAISGIEQALWDILGKALGVPVYELLGGRVRDRVRLYANGPRGEHAGGGRRIVRAARGGRLGRAQAGALRGGAGSGRATASCARRAAGCELIRDAVGPDVDILIDCHGRLSPTAAVQMAEALDEFDIFFFEEPVLPEDPRAMAEVAASDLDPGGDRRAAVHQMGIPRRAGARRGGRAAARSRPLRRHLGGAQDRRGGGSLTTSGSRRTTPIPGC